jgi:ferrous iron transport protein A
MTLDEMKPRQECEIVDVITDGILGQRLMDMGFIPGTRIRIIRNAPLIDPIEIEVKGYNVSIRHSEAKEVEVKTF